MCLSVFLLSSEGTQNKFKYNLLIKLECKNKVLMFHVFNIKKYARLYIFMYVCLLSSEVKNANYNKECSNKLNWEIKVFIFHVHILKNGLVVCQSVCLLPSDVKNHNLK